VKNASGSVLLSLDLPDGGPKAVKAAQAEFDRVANEVARLQGEKSDTRRALELAKKADRAAYAAELAKDFDALPGTCRWERPECESCA
jgi:hypothetical protein